MAGELYNFLEGVLRPVTNIYLPGQGPATTVGGGTDNRFAGTGNQHATVAPTGGQIIRSGSNNTIGTQGIDDVTAGILGQLASYAVANPVNNATMVGGGIKNRFGGQASGLAPSGIVGSGVKLYG